MMGIGRDFVRAAAIDANILVGRASQRLSQRPPPLAQQINRRHDHQRCRLHLGNRQRAHQRLAAALSGGQPNRGNPPRAARRS